MYVKKFKDKEKYIDFGHCNIYIFFMNEVKIVPIIFPLKAIIEYL